MIFTIGNGTRSVSFEMHIDPSHPQDQAVLHYYGQGIPPEQEVVHFMLRAVKEGDVCIDAGANIGFFTLLLSKLIGDKGEVFAVEPSKSNLGKLHRNVSKLKNIFVVAHALSNYNGVSKMFVYADGGFDSLKSVDEQIAAQQTAVVSTLDSLYFDGPPTFMNINTEDAEYDAMLNSKKLLASNLRYFVGPPTFMKMDIEGAEYDAMLGGKKLLASSLRYVVSELNEKALARFGHSVEDYIGFFHEHGFEVFELSPTGGLPALIPRTTRVVPTRENCNVLFSKMEWVAEAYPEIRI